MENQTTNGTTNGKKEKEPTCLDGSKAKFAERTAKGQAPKPEELKKAVQAYFKLDDELSKLEEQSKKLKLERTEATKKIVELRGMSRMTTASRGIGQITARSESAWIAFGTAGGDAIDA